MNHLLSSEMMTHMFMSWRSVISLYKYLYPWRIGIRSDALYYKTLNVHSLWDTNPDGKRNTFPKVLPKKPKRNH